MSYNFLGVCKFSNKLLSASTSKNKFLQVKKDDKEIVEQVE